MAIVRVCSVREKGGRCWNVSRRALETVMDRRQLRVDDREITTPRPYHLSASFSSPFHSLVVAVAPPTDKE